MNPRDRWDERLAIRCIGSELGVEVVVHDDGSEQSMYDLIIVYPDRPPGAVEVTAAADPDAIALGRLVYDAERWIVPDIVGGWAASVRPTARWRDIQARLPALLRAMEGQGVLRAEPEIWWQPGPYDEELEALGILHLMQSGTDFPGSVYLIIEQGLERTAGAVPTSGRPLIEWLAEWFDRADKTDNLRKLDAAGAEERHLFLILPSFAEAPFAVTDLLSRDGAPLPEDSPQLPREVSHVWVVSTWSSGSGVRWSPDGGWSRFDKPGD